MKMLARLAVVIAICLPVVLALEYTTLDAGAKLVIGVIAGALATLLTSE